MTRSETFRRFSKVLQGVGELAPEPGAGDGPVTLDGFWRDAQRHGDFVDRQAAEITELHDLGLAGREPRQPFERLVERLPAIAFGGIDQGDGFGFGFIKGDAALILAASFFPAAAAGVFNEHLPHQVRSDAHEPGPVFPVVAPARGEPQIDLVDKRCRLKGMAGAFLPQVVMRKASQLGVHHRQEFVGVRHLRNYARAVLTSV